MITKRQYNILSFYLTRALFLGGGLSLLVGLSKNDILVSGILGMLLGYFLLYLLFKKGNTNILVNIVIAGCVLFFNVISSTILTSSYLLNSTPVFLIILVMLITLLYASCKEFKVIGRITEIFIIIASIEIIFSVIGMVPSIKIDNMLPLFSSKIFNILKGIIVFTGASLLPNILLINYKDKLKFRDVSYGYVVGSLLMIIVLFLIVTMYGSQFAMQARFPEFLILKKIDLFGYVNNVENILVTEWLINVLICSLVCVKVLKDNMSKVLFYIIIGAIFLSSIIVLNSSYSIILIIKNYYYYISFILCLISLVFKKLKNS